MNFGRESRPEGEGNLRGNARVGAAKRATFFTYFLTRKSTLLSTSFMHWIVLVTNCGNSGPFNVFPIISEGKFACSCVLAAPSRGGEFTQPLPHILWKKYYTKFLINSSCGALHNIAVKCNDPEPPEPELDEELEQELERQQRRRPRPEEDREEDRGPMADVRSRALGQLKRNEIAEEYC